MALLDVEGLVAGYGPVTVLRGVAMVVEAGEIVVVLGANGAGKTTLMRALSGMIPATGRATIDGENILGRRADRVARMGVSHVPQGRGTIVDLTVDDNLRVGAYARRDGEIRSDIEAWYERFPRLAERRGQMAGSMSGGEQQMLAIARALMARPKLVLLDEPSLGLAPMVTAELFATLGELNAQHGTAMLIVEQNANLALRIGSRGYVLETGSVVASGSTQELASDPTVRQAYLGGGAT